MAHPFHDLRQTAASLLLDHGIPVLIVSKRLGHAKPSITLDIYGHLIPTMQEQVAQIKDEVMTPIEFGKVAPRLHHRKGERRSSIQPQKVPNSAFFAIYGVVGLERVTSGL